MTTTITYKIEPLGSNEYMHPPAQLLKGIHW